MLSRRKITFFIVLSALLVFSCITVPCALSQSTATIMGQVNVNNKPVNGATVTCGALSPVTTGNYMGQDGIYMISGVPYGTSLPFTASYQNHTYKDTIDPLTNSSQTMYWLGTTNIDIPVETPTPVPTVTPSPSPTVTPTPVPNSTITPTPSANATPSPTATPTASPTATATPTATPTPTPTATPTANPAPAAAPPSGPSQAYNYPSAGSRQTAAVMATPTPIPAVSVTPTPAQAPIISPAPTAMPTSAPVPSPTKTRSPGFAMVLALACLLTAAYLAIKKGR